VANEIKTAGGNMIALPNDISKEEAVENMVQTTLDAFGKIDILVNNAGILEE
jgi:NAD(P)-dependent dehydrogenase (short-subunit alcohol dehydrogenase family)